MLAQKVPYEVLLQIFQHLPIRTNILECALVCHSWSTPSIEALHQKVMLSEEDILYLKYKFFKKEEEEEAPFQKYGRFVKQLSIKDKSSLGSFTREEFTTLMSYIPHLKTINLRSSGHNKFYLDCLRNINSDTMLTQLEEISSRNNPYHRRLVEYEEALFMACLNFSNSLKKVNFHYREMNYMSDRDDTIGDMLHFLPQFCNLTHLSLENSAVADLTSFDLLEMFPNLIKLKFKSSQFIVPTKVNDIVQTLLDAPTAAAMIASPPAYYGTTLRKLHLTLPIVTKSYVKYFIHCLPKLHSFKISMEGISLYDWMDYIGQELLEKFYGRLKLLKNVNISSNVDKYVTHQDHLAARETQRRRSTVDFFDLARESVSQKLVSKNHTSQQKVNSICRGIENILPNNIRQGEEALTTCSAVYKLITPTGIEEDSIGLHDNHVEYYCSLQYNPSDPSNIPRPTASVGGPEMITYLQIVAIIDTTTDDLTPALRLLKFGLMNFPRLQYMSVTCCNLTKTHTIFLSSLDLPTANSRRPSTATTQEYLRKIALDGGLISQPMLDLVADLLPYIQVITFGTSIKPYLFHFGNIDEIEVTPYVIKMDLTRFTQLNNVTINALSFAMGLRHLFIIFDYVNGPTQYYDLDIAPTNRDMQSAFKETTFVFMEETRHSSVRSRVLLIKCNKDIDEFVICTNEKNLAVFKFGDLQKSTLPFIRYNPDSLPF